MMEKHELAKQLDGTEYPVRISLELAEQARENGLVIVYGDSHDLMEFEGAIRDEAGCFDGGTVLVDPKGLLPDFENLEVTQGPGVFEEYFNRKRASRSIEALWDKEPDFRWTYKTEIPHATFEVWEDGGGYCRGIVFSLSDLPSKDDQSDGLREPVRTVPETLIPFSKAPLGARFQYASDGPDGKTYWHEVCGLKIKKVEILRETPKMLVIMDDFYGRENKVKKIGQYHRYFPSFREAKEAVCRSYRLDLQKAQRLYDEALALREEA